MKKTINIGILILALITLITGCKKNENNNNMKDEKLINGSYEEKKNLSDYVEGRTIKCSLLNENVISYLDNFVDFNSKDIYHINFNQLYSNNENCIKVFTANNNIVGTINYGYNSGMVDKNGHVYVIMDGKIYKDIGKYSAYLPKDDELMSSLSFGLFIHSVYNKTNKSLIIYENYKEDIEKKYIVDTSVLKDEDVKINYGDVIKTEKKYYQVVKTITNKEDCDKYADIECKYKYEIKNNEIMSDSYNEILRYINGKIIMKDLNVIDFYKIKIEE